MTHATDELKRQIQEVIQTVEIHVQVLTRVMHESADMGGHVLSLRTHNLDVAHASGLLHSTIPLDIEHTITHYKLVLQTLYNYIAEL